MKAFFLTRVLREKIMLLAFVLIAAVMWLSSVGRRASELGRMVGKTNSELAAQKLTFDAKALIEARAAEAIKQLDPAKAFDRVRLSTEIDTMARSVGLRNTSTGDMRTEPAGQLAINTVTVSINNAEYKSLVDFYLKIVEHAPYIGIEKFTVASMGGNAGQLRATLVLSSVEIVR